MSSGEDVRLEAQNEIRQTLNLCSFYARQVGLFFTDDPPSNLLQKLKNKAAFVLSAAALLLLVAGELAYVLSLLAANTSVAEFVASLHIAGYGFISVGKMAIIWYKQDIFKQLVRELADLWPVRKDDGEAAEIKQRSLNALRFFHIFYTAFTVLGVALYNLTPIALHAWRSARGARSELGFVWHVAYPFDKRHPVYHKIAYAFEVCSGVSSVFFMLSSDLLFTATTSHITMLLRLLQLKIRRLAPERGTAGGGVGGRGAGGHWVATEDCLTEIVSCVKVHQRLIKYFNDLEKAFSLVNLINTVLSSVDICCVVFVIVLLEPWMEVSNKFFLVAAVTQIGILCWYADDLQSASVGVSDAVYESGWFRCNTECRRLLVNVIQRSQKPLYFTAMKFNNITMRTYASILTTAYSYFALLYSMYSKN